MVENCNRWLLKGHQPEERGEQVSVASLLDATEPTRGREAELHDKVFLDTIISGEASSEGTFAMYALGLTVPTGWCWNTSSPAVTGSCWNTSSPAVTGSCWNTSSPAVGAVLESFEAWMLAAGQYCGPAKAASVIALPASSQHRRQSCYTDNLLKPSAKISSLPLGCFCQICCHSNKR